MQLDGVTLMMSPGVISACAPQTEGWRYKAGLPCQTDGACFPDLKDLKLKRIHLFSSTLPELKTVVVLFGFCLNPYEFHNFFLTDIQ